VRVRTDDSWLYIGRKDNGRNRVFRIAAPENPDREASKSLQGRSR